MLMEVNPMSGKYFYQRYLISEKLGEGGFSVVYKAFDTIDNIHVVIKFLKPQMMKNDAIVETFKKEATDAVNLDHPCHQYECQLTVRF